jgi:hypothetical protein
MKAWMGIGMAAVIEKPFDFKHVIGVEYFLGA